MLVYNFSKASLKFHVTITRMRKATSWYKRLHNRFHKAILDPLIWEQTLDETLKWVSEARVLK